MGSTPLDIILSAMLSTSWVVLSAGSPDKAQPYPDILFVWAPWDGPQSSQGDIGLIDLFHHNLSPSG